jgi:hypothetical protein
MAPSGIEPATYRFVAQYLNHCATISGPHFILIMSEISPFLCTNTVVVIKYAKADYKKLSPQSYDPSYSFTANLITFPLEYGMWRQMEGKLKE